MKGSGNDVYAAGMDGDERKRGVELTTLTIEEEEEDSGDKHVYSYRGGEPPFKHISRTLDVRKSTWDKFVGRSYGRRNSGVFTSVLQAPDEVACQSKRYWNSTKNMGSEDAPSAVQKCLLGWPMISPYSRLALAWSLFMLFIDSTYTAFMVPIIIAFVGNGENGYRLWANIVDAIAGGIFLLDIFLNFSIGFVVNHNYQKKVVMDRRSVSWYYLRHGGAWIDFLAVLPLFLEIRVLVEGNSSGNHCGDICLVNIISTVFRLVRLLRIRRFLKMLFTKCAAGSDLPIVGKISPATFYFANVMYTLAVMVNFLGCLLYGIARWEGLENSWIAESGHLGDSDLRMYLTSIYWATVTVTTVGYGEMTPVTALETVAVLIILIFALVGFGMLIGSAGEVLGAGNEASRRAERLRNKMVDVDGWIKSRKLSRANERKIRAYYTEVWSRHPEYDESSLLDELPVELRSDVVFQVVDKTLDRLEVFEHMDDSLQRIVASRLIPHTIPPGHNICRQGDTKEAMYILQEGVIEGYVGDIMVQRFQGPTTIGEDAVLGLDEGGTSVESMTLLSAAPCKLWELPLQDLEAMFVTAPQLKTDLLSRCQAKILDRIRATSAISSTLSRSTTGISANLTQRLKAVTSAMHPNERSSSSEKEVVPNDMRYSPSTGKPSAKQSGSSWNLLQDKKRQGTFSTVKRSTSQHSTENLSDDRNKVLRQERLDNLMQHILKLGAHGLVEFARELKMRMKLASKGGSHIWEFKKYLAIAGLQQDDIDGFCKIYIKQRSVQWRDLLDDLKSQQMSPERLLAAESLFATLISNGRQSGKDISDDGILLQHLICDMNPGLHPDVENGHKDEFGVTLEVLESFGGLKYVQANDFLNYLGMVSICIEKDENFTDYCNRFWSAQKG